MIKNYFKLAFRNLINNKLFSFVNIFGLAVAFGSALIIFQYVWFELSYNDDIGGSNLYSLKIDWVTPKETKTGRYSGHRCAEILSSDIPEIVEVSRNHIGSHHA